MIRPFVSYQDDTQEWENRYKWIKVLWFRVVQRAMYDYCLYKRSKDIRNRRLADSSSKWLFGRQAGPGSLIFICQQLDWDIERIRKKAKRLTPDAIKKIEHVDRQREIGKVVRKGLRDLELELGL